MQSVCRTGLGNGRRPRPVLVWRATSRRNLPMTSTLDDSTDQWNVKRHSYPFLNTEFLFVTYFGCFGNELEDLSREMCPISYNKYRKR
jgi:hypothetical protein